MRRIVYVSLLAMTIPLLTWGLISCQIKDPILPKRNIILFTEFFNTYSVV
jgi:hypothetical protein